MTARDFASKRFGWGVFALALTSSVESLLPTPPRPGRVIATREITEVGVSEWKLSNGLRVVVKPTELKNDEVRLAAFSPGGHSLVADADLDSARFAAVIVANSGLGAMDAGQLRRALAGKNVEIHPFIDELEEGISARSSPADLETLLQLVHLSFAAPRRDETAFQVWRARELERLRNRRFNSEQRFFDDLTVFLSGNHPRRQPITAAAIERVSLDRALAIYRDRFADAGDFTVVIVGKVGVERLKPLVETYLGSLPDSGRREKWRDVGVQWPPGIETLTVIRGSEPRSLLRIVFHGPQRWSRKAENELRLLAEAFRVRLRDAFRTELEAVFDVQVLGNLSRRPREEFTLTVQLDCAADRAAALKKAVFDQINRIAELGVDDDQVRTVKTQWSKANEVIRKDNRFWIEQLVAMYRYGDDPKLIPIVEPFVAAATPNQVRAAARRYLRNRPYLTAVLRPAALPHGAADGRISQLHHP